MNTLFVWIFNARKVYLKYKDTTKRPIVTKKNLQRFTSIRLEQYNFENLSTVLVNQEKYSFERLTTIITLNFGLKNLVVIRRYIWQERTGKYRVYLEHMKME